MTYKYYGNSYARLVGQGHKIGDTATGDEVWLIVSRPYIYMLVGRIEDIPETKSTVEQVFMGKIVDQCDLPDDIDALLLLAAQGMVIRNGGSFTTYHKGRLKHIWGIVSGL